LQCVFWHVGQNDYWFVLDHAAKLPEAKIRPIFDRSQWQMLISQLTQAIGMGQWLKDNGDFAGAEPAVAKSAAAGAPVPLRAGNPTAGPEKPKLNEED
jgi:hypothetical protein